MKLKVTVDGKQYEVDVDVAEPEQPHPIYIPAVGQPRTPSAQPREQRSPPPRPKRSPKKTKSAAAPSPALSSVFRPRPANKSNPTTC